MMDCGGLQGHSRGGHPPLCPVSLTGLDPIVTFGIGGRLVKTQDSDPSYQAGPACQVITAIMALEVR